MANCSVLPNRANCLPGSAIPEPRPARPTSVSCAEIPPAAAVTVTGSPAAAPALTVAVKLRRDSLGARLHRRRHLHRAVAAGDADLRGIGIRGQPQLAGCLAAGRDPRGEACQRELRRARVLDCCSRHRLCRSIAVGAATAAFISLWISEAEQRPVIDADFIDEAAEVLAPNAVAADAQHARGCLDAARGGLAARQHPIHVDLQRGAVECRRQVRPRVHRDRRRATGVEFATR